MNNKPSALRSEPSFAVICSLSSGLYRRPRNYTGSADPSGQSQKALAGFMRLHIYRRWGIAPRPENVFPACAGRGHICWSQLNCKSFIMAASQDTATTQLATDQAAATSLFNTATPSLAAGNKAALPKPDLNAKMVSGKLGMIISASNRNLMAHGVAQRPRNPVTSRFSFCYGGYS